MTAGKDVLVEDGLEIGRVHVRERLGAGAADVVDDDVDATELIDGCCDDRRCPLRCGDVGDDADRSPRAVDRANRGVELVTPARAEDDVRTLLGEAGRDAAADAPARAGHDRDFAGEPEIHAGILRAGHASARVHVAGVELVPDDEGVAGLQAELTHDDAGDRRQDPGHELGWPALEGADPHDRRVSRVGLVERRVVDPLAIGTGGKRLPGDPRSRRLLAELPADGVRDRTRDEIEVDADALTERGHLNDGHPPTFTVGG